MWNRKGGDTIIEKPDEEDNVSSIKCSDSHKGQRKSTRQRTLVEKIIDMNSNKESKIDVFSKVGLTLKQKQQLKNVSHDNGPFNIKKLFDNSMNKGYVNLDKSKNEMKDKSRFTSYVDTNLSTKDEITDRLKQNNVNKIHIIL
jgi:hypothetical protein